MTTRVTPLWRWKGSHQVVDHEPHDQALQWLQDDNNRTLSHLMTAIQAGMNKRIREKQTAIENRLFCTDLAQNETDLI